MWGLPSYYPSLVTSHGAAAIRRDSSTHTADLVFQPSASRERSCMVTTSYYHFLTPSTQSAAVTIFMWAMPLKDFQPVVCYSKRLASQQAGNQTYISKLFCLIATAITGRQKSWEPFVQYSSSCVPKGSRCWMQSSPMKTSSEGNHAEIRPYRLIHLQAISGLRCPNTEPDAWQCVHL